jgi:hypothetical protein
VRLLELIVSTGNDDLRGGSNSGDNCDVSVALKSGSTIKVANANSGATWAGWSKHVVVVPLPAGGIKSGDVTAVSLHTGFRGGAGGDNWNVNRLQLRAMLKGTATDTCPTHKLFSIVGGPWLGCECPPGTTKWVRTPPLAAECR